MTLTSDRSSTSDSARRDTFDSVDPAIGQVLASYPIHGSDDVVDAVDRGRAAAEFWTALTFGERSRRLTQWAGVLSRRMAQLAGQINAETGKPHSDAQLEIVLGIENIVWAATHAAKVLGSRRVSSGFGSNHAATVEYRPFGVVGVIGPWNYPVYTPLGSIAYALAAGNTVVFKPSEYTPGVGAVAGRRLRRRWCPRRRCCNWSPASATPGPRCAGPGSTRSRSPVALAPQEDAWPPVPRR